MPGRVLVSTGIVKRWACARSAHCTVCVPEHVVMCDTPVRSVSAAADRWKILKRAIAIAKCADQEHATNHTEQCWQRTSVRRFSTFKLFDVEPVPTDNNGKETAYFEWVAYRYRDNCCQVSAVVRNLTAPSSLSAMAGFNNTGNVCVWPSEEVMAWFCLRNAQRFKGASVCELGCGMAGLAGLMLACTGVPSRVLLTDGNETSVRNVDAILSANSAALSTTTAAACTLRWGEPYLFERSPHDSSFDVVLCADCTFFTELHLNLTKVMLKLLKPGGIVWLFAPERGSSMQKFTEVAANDFQIQRIDVYDEVVFRKHKEAKSSEDGSYDPDIHYPILLIMQPIRRGDKCRLALELEELSLKA